METPRGGRGGGQTIPFNFLASLINGNYGTSPIFDVKIYTFNFLASLINGNQDQRGYY